MAMLQEEARGDLSTSLAPFLAVPLPWIATNIRTKREARVLLNIGITARRFDELTRHLTTSVLQARSAATQGAHTLLGLPSAGYSLRNLRHAMLRTLDERGLPSSALRLSSHLCLARLLLRWCPQHSGPSLGLCGL